LNIFSKSFPKFIGGQHITNTAKFLQASNRTARISARDHFKSTSLYAFIMWRLWCDWDRNVEAHYFSFSQKMSEYHIRKIKSFIATNPFFIQCQDLKRNAEGVMKYSWDGQHFFSLDPHGLLTFKRGIHCEDIYIDDPFQDPENKMLLTNIMKINRIVTSNILEMPNRYLHIVGTPQTNDDFFFDKKVMSRFAVDIMPAIQNEAERKVLWEEYIDWDELMSRKGEKGEKIFNCEYMCSPVYAEEAFFTRTQLMPVVKDIKPLDIGQKHNLDGEVVGGFDIGKKAHPSHLSVFQVNGEKWKMIYQLFMDSWDYNRQLEYLEMAIENLGIDYLYYDDTRGELESLKEQNKIPHQMKPINFNTKTKFSMASEFDKLVSNNNIELINDRRFIEQMLLVTNDLQALETPEGHADSFWSTCLCFNYLLQPKPEIRFI